MSSYTHGPWTYERTGLGWQVLYDVDKGDGGGWLASLGYVNGEADARMMAAAPELYQALTDIVTYCECAPPGGDASMLYELFHAARAAIEKATGATA